MSHHRFINDPARLVSASLHSITLTNPGIGLDAENKILYVRPNYIPLASPCHQKQRVSLISGGGAGHEPSFAGLVGPGLLSAAVVGSLFASPNAQQVLAAIKSTSSQDSKGHEDSDSIGANGTLVIVMNYTGDVLNFGVGVEVARASSSPGAKTIDMVVVGDDVAVPRSRAGKVGRRGVAGTVLVLKIAGALAQRGYGLDEVAAVARRVAANVATLGATLGQIHVPGVTDSPASGGNTTGGNGGQVEMGTGIHNEQGSSRYNFSSGGLDDLIDRMLAQLLATDDPERSFVDFLTQPRAPVVLLVNNLGGLSVLELGAITSAVVLALEMTHGLRPVLLMSGTYMTSIDSRGFSITLLRLVDLGLAGTDVHMLQLLLDSCEAPGWHPIPASAVMSHQSDFESWGETSTTEVAVFQDSASGLTVDPQCMTSVLETGLRSVISCEPEVTRFDMLVGDGDCGTTLKRGAEAVLSELGREALTGDVVRDTSRLARVVERAMDGTSGAIYSLFLNALVSALRKAGPGAATVRVWAAALSESAAVLGKYTPARVGDRTLIDALHPFVKTLSSTGNVTRAADASLKAAEATKGMRASLGRSVYVGGDDFERVPDPGAWGLAQFFVGLASKF